MGFEGADGKEGLIRGMKGEREREREKGKSGGRRQRRPPSSSSKNDVFIGVDLGQRSRLLYRPAVVFSGRAGSFFLCALNWTILEGGGLPSYSVGMCVNISSSSGVALTRQKFN